MVKYHKNIGFYPCHEAEAKSLIASLFYRKIAFSSHAVNELMVEPQAEKIGRYLYLYTLNFDDIFEIVIDAGIIQKMGFRIKFDENRDIIFIMNREKMVITLWTNDKNDIHKTLKKDLYCKPLSFNKI